MHLGICTSASTGAAALASAPIDYIEEHVQKFLAPEGPEADFVERCRAAANAARPISVACCFLPGTLTCIGPSVDRPRLVAYATSAFARARRAGIDTIVFGSGAARQVPDGFSAARAFEQMIELLRELAPLAARHGVTMVIEPLNRGECNLITTLREGAEVVQRTDHPAVRLLADIYHMMRDDESPDEIRRHGALLHHAHIAERAKRTAPGIAGDDFRPYLTALREAGYDRRLSLECGFGDLAGELKPALTALRRQLSEVGYG